jgi:outer membrane protein assembly factor BamB
MPQLSFLEIIMNRAFVVGILFFSILAVAKDEVDVPPQKSENSTEVEWSQWRGSYDGDGIIPGGPIVTAWSETENIIWQTPVPGRGASSPIIAGDRLFLTTADDDTGEQFILCYSRNSGDMLWKGLVFVGEFLVPSHHLNTEASPTPVTNGKVVVAMFGIDASQSLVAYDMDGTRLWTTKIADLDSRFGVGSSPILYKEMVIVLNDNRPNTFIAAYDIKTGARVWKTDRVGDPESYKDNVNYVTPRIFHIEGQDQLFATGFGEMISYDPNTGKELWKTEGGARISVGAPVIGNGLVFFSGGFPETNTFAFNVKTKMQEWSNRIASYIVSSVFYEGYLYASNNRGELSCADAATGEILWRKLLKVETQSSPFVTGGYLYFILGDGTTKVIQPSPEKYLEVAENIISGATQAVPAVINGLIYYRGEGMLYCIGEL